MQWVFQWPYSPHSTWFPYAVLDQTGLADRHARVLYKVYESTFRKHYCKMQNGCIMHI